MELYNKDSLIYLTCESMALERKSGYELQFIDDKNFEIIYLDYNDTFGVRSQLEKADFVVSITSVDERDETYLQKIIGVTNSKDEMVALLNNWFDLINSIEVAPYTDIN